MAKLIEGDDELDEIDGVPSAEGVQIYLCPDRPIDHTHVVLINCLGEPFAQCTIGQDLINSFEKAMKGIH